MDDSLMRDVSASGTISRREALSSGDRKKLFQLLGACFFADAVLILMITTALG